MSKETLKAIETSIEKYVTNSSPELLQEILGATAELSSVYQGEVFGHLKRL